MSVLTSKKTAEGLQPKGGACFLPVALVRTLRAVLRSDLPRDSSLHETPHSSVVVPAIPFMGQDHLPRQKSSLALRAVIICGFSSLGLLLRKVSDPGVARCAGRPSAVHKPPRSLRHKCYRARII